MAMRTPEEASEHSDLRPWMMDLRSEPSGWIGGLAGIELAPIQMRGHNVSTVDKAKNKAQEAKGRVKEAAGKATDDQSLEAEGKGDKVAGNLKQAGEKVKDAFKK